MIWRNAKSSGLGETGTVWDAIIQQLVQVWLLWIIEGNRDIAAAGAGLWSKKGFLKIPKYLLKG